mmetsp:Transcript_47973/g.135067  ORF Transcript_47973/g.135067 Transcript_47973/m.135067 type:complete len:206 (+) Transcript_47973:157-774(+)
MRLGDRVVLRRGLAQRVVRGRRCMLGQDLGALRRLLRKRRRLHLHKPAEGRILAHDADGLGRADAGHQHQGAGAGRQRCPGAARQQRCEHLCRYHTVAVPLGHQSRGHAGGVVVLLRLAAGHRRALRWRRRWEPLGRYGRRRGRASERSPKRQPVGRCRTEKPLAAGPVADAPRPVADAPQPPGASPKRLWAAPRRFVARLGRRR